MGKQKAAGEGERENERTLREGKLMGDVKINGIEQQEECS